MKKIAILYHGECWDGFGGAYAAWKAFGGRAEYYPLKHSGDLPVLTNKTVYIIDFGLKESQMKKMLAANKKVVALDHHVTAEKTTKMAHDYVYALKNSGAVIAWKYFNPKKAAPWLLRHIEDIDLWRFKLPHTRELTAYLNLIEYNFRLWDKIAKDWENSKNKSEYVKKGELVLKYEAKMTEDLLENAELAAFEGCKTLVVNSPVLHSEIGSALVQKMPPIGVVWSERDKIIRVSLRSNGDVDVAKIAEKYGGGGHKRASGFPLPVGKPFPWQLL